MAGNSTKLIAILLAAIVVASSVGYWTLAPKTSPVEISTSRIGLTSSNYTSEQIQSSSTSSKSVTPTTATTQWISIGEVKSVSYYLTLLESNGTAPYVQLASELRKLPDLQNATAVATIAYLALNATNPEVKEAFTLMMKGGTPDPRDFQYPVLQYNTELQVLYWLASQNEFKKDDTLALAVAMVNGFWVTIGDDQVRQAVQNDTTQLLRFFRETNELQKQNGYYLLEDYPLEAKICLAWTASITPNYSALPLVWGVSYQDVRARGYLMNGTRVTLEGYHWNSVSLATLRTMRDTMTKNGWIHKDPSETVPFLEQYFYFSDRHLIGHWENEPVYLIVDGRRVHDYTIGNVNWQLDFYLRTGKFQGQCADESQWIDAWAKSWGLATTTIWRGGFDSEGNVPANLVNVQHFHPIFYDPASESWKASGIQLDVGVEDAGDNPLIFMIFRPPIDQQGYFSTTATPPFYPNLNWSLGDNPNMFYWYPNRMTLGGIKSLLTTGLETSTLKAHILYGQP